MAQATTTPPTVHEPLSRPLAQLITLDWYRVSYAAIILLAIVSRFWGLGDRVVSHDESLHTQYAYQYYIGDGYQHQPLMHGPFLFHITAVSYWLFGDNDFTARIPVALFGIVLVLIPHFLRRWIGRRGALFASFIFLISPYVLYYSRYIRHDLYVIVWALLVFIGTWGYIRSRENKYLWLFAAGNALMAATKEVSFIYVAIFGSFLVLRLLNEIWGTSWLKEHRRRLLTPGILLLFAVLMAGGGYLVSSAASEAGAGLAETIPGEGFAADPTEAEGFALPTGAAAGAFWGWVAIAGFALIGLALFLGVRELRPHIDAFPEFDLIILYVTLLLPTIPALFTYLAGWSPTDSSYIACVVPGGDTLSAVGVAAARFTSGACWSHFFSQGLVRSGLFLVPTLAVSVAVGLWWDSRRWWVAAAVFHTIFALLYTSLFTFPAGWFSGSVKSLGYWIEQQSVQRGSQPALYYFFVVPFYEFLPLLFSLLAFRLWARQQKVNRILGYWVSVLLLAAFTYSFGNWLYNRPIRVAGGTPTAVAGIVGALFILVVAALYWLFVHQRRLLAAYEQRRSWWGIVDRRALTGFVPGLIYWLILTWVAYSVAGEKMPWLSTHFVIPMAFLTGWYMNQRLKGVSAAELLSRRSLLHIGLTIVAIIAAGFALSPLLLGTVRLGDQSLVNLTALSRLFGSLLAAGAVLYAWWAVSQRNGPAASRRALLLGVFGLLSLLTIRFSYMANFPNADYTTEFLVYAHGAPHTKSEVMAQVEALSFRLYGDKSIDVAYDNDSSWPLTWYLRDYPQRTYFGESPSRDLLESPAIIVGSNNWGAVEPILGDQYQVQTFTFLWWPMEQYRQISWDAIFGFQNGAPPPDPAQRRGLGNPAVRHALWDIFFYRDYEKYGEVFGGTYTAGRWPLRHDLRLYIRKDVLATLWDFGASAVNAEIPEPAYAEGEISAAAALVIGEPGALPGQLNSPRNLAVAPDGRLYIVDSGNHRVQVFDAAGNYITHWGTFGEAPGQFNEPWGIAVDEAFVYVADTWNHRVQKFTLEGELVASVGAIGRIGAGEPGADLYFGPRDIILLPEGQLAVTDTGNHRIVVLNRSDLSFVSQTGGEGAQLGQFQEPVGLAYAPDGSVYVADTWNGRIQQLWTNLLPLNEWRVDAWFGQSINNKPYIAVASTGHVLTTDPENFRVLIFDDTGQYVGRLGQFGNDDRGFGLPNGLALDAADNLYIADAANNRILRFNAADLGLAEAPTLEEDLPSEP